MSKRTIAIAVGTACGLALGVTTRSVLLTIIAKPADSAEMHQEQPAPPPSQSAARTEIRRVPPAASAAAQAAVESGSTQFILRPGPGCHQEALVEILISMGALPISKQGEAISVLRQGAWTSATNLAEFSNYAVSRAFETNTRSLGVAATGLPASAQTYLLLPLNEESRLVGAVEAVLTMPIQGCALIEIQVSRTSAGHVRWRVARVSRKDGSQLQPNLELSM